MTNKYLVDTSKTQGRRGHVRGKQSAPCSYCCCTESCVTVGVALSLSNDVAAEGWCWSSPTTLLEKTKTSQA
jgi:hypothetical protein